MTIEPKCTHCGKLAKLVGGDMIYPHRPDLADRKFYLCFGCDSYVGCHAGEKNKPLGYPANPELRRARSLLHKERFDPVWMEAWRDYVAEPTVEEKVRFSRIARARTYAFLASRMGMTRQETHISMLDLEGCRAAWQILTGLRYGVVRAWWKSEAAKAGNGDTKLEKGNQE
jgi:hypothetical protein